MVAGKYANLYAMFKATVEARRNHTALKWFTGRGDPGDEASLTWQALDQQVRQTAQSLLSAGIEKGDKVAVISRTCPRWVIADLAITAVGACTVGIYPSNPAPDCRYIIDHSDAVLVLAEDAEQLAKLLDIKSQLAAVRRVVLFNGAPPAGEQWVMAFDDFMAQGAGATPDRLAAALEAVRPQDPAGIIYTSGTTGVPKGVVLTHDNILFTARSVHQCGEFGSDDTTFLFLPLAHVFARTCFYTTIMIGHTTVFSRGLETLGEDIRRARPHWFVSVPRIFEKVHARIVQGAETKGGVTLKLFRWALRVGAAVSDHICRGQTAPINLRIQAALADRLVFRKIRAALGGRLRWCICGAAPLNPDLARFFHACGILILEGLGMTENTSFSNVNRPDGYRFGSVGPPGPGIEQKVAADGEILFKGRNVMAGYYKMSAATDEAITPDGWLRTGDMGRIDDDGFLWVTGRKKELIITSGGKNIAPAPIENRLCAGKYINQACVIGDGRPYLTALLTLDPAPLEALGRRGGTRDKALRNCTSIRM